MKFAGVIVYTICLLLLSNGHTMAQQQGKDNFDSTFAAIRAIKNDSVRLATMYEFQVPFRDSDPQRALKIALVFNGMAWKTHDDLKIAGGYSMTAWAYYRLKNNPEALKYFIKNLELCKKINDPDGLAKAYLGLAKVYEDGTPEDLKKALGYLEQSRDICLKHQDLEYYLLNVYSDLGVVYERLKDYSKATEQYNEGLKIARRLQSPRKEMVLLCNLANTLKESNNPDKAMAAYVRAGLIADSMQHDYGRAVVGANLAGLYEKMGKLDEAAQKGTEALALSLKLQQRDVEVAMYKVLKDVYTRKKMYPQALDYFTKWTKLKDTLNNKEKASELSELQTRYETSIKDQQIAAKDGELAFNRKRNAYYIVAISLLALVGSVIFISYRRTSKLNTRIVQQQNELLLKTSELEQVNAVKDRLFSVISHDLRTPVNSLISFTMLLRNQQLPPEKLSQYTATLNNSLTATADLLENLLHFAKTQIAATTPVLQETDLRGVAADTLQLMAETLALKKITVANNIPADAIVLADINMISLIFRNLLSNAIKYTHSNSTITLSAHREEGRIFWQVKDEGIGMSPDMVAAFNSRLDDNNAPLESTPGTANEKGTGLGLMLCITFVKQMGGKISLESEEGKGCRFTVELPAA